MPSWYIAGVTRDGKFAGAMINQATQLVFMDEWTNDSLCCEDFLLHVITSFKAITLEFIKDCLQT